MRIFRFRKDLVPLVMNGRKSLTSRNRKYQGVYEVAYGSRFKPIRTGYLIELEPLWFGEKKEIATRWYINEGFDSFEACLKALNELHPNQDKLWVHTIKRKGWI